MSVEKMVQYLCVGPAAGHTVKAGFFFFFKDVLLVILPKSIGVSLLSPSESSF